MDSDNNVKCVLCEMSEENKVTGALSSKEEVTAHQNCLLYSSGLFCRESPQLDDLFGFSVEDVLSERQRGRKLSCKKCNKKGATVGCENGRCQKSYHYPCAIQAGAHTVEDKENGQFGIYCLRCKKSKLGLCDDDSNSSNVSTHNPKKKLDFSDCHQKKVRKRSRIESDSDSDVTNCEEIFAPLEFDLDENANSAPKELVSIKCYFSHSKYMMNITIHIHTFIPFPFHCGPFLKQSNG
uniref:PHD-type domain-containing protein n=1 Tax=Neogobius melanostomus TaxID=47308 RepID=A0A8C6S7Y8_9GOBI